MKRASIACLLAGILALGGTSVQAQIIYKNKQYQWKGNEFVQGKFKATATSPTSINSNYQPVETDFGMQTPDEYKRTQWQLQTNIGHLPHYTADNVMENAMYNLSLEESVQAIEPDSTFRTGVFWGGVWTRDVSYSILHSLAQICPEVSMNSLLAKINANNRIIQDTGTGGAWPCSTDRTTWVLAAWETYKVTGDKQFLDRIFPVIKNTIDDDAVVAYNPQTQLMKGETSYLDWREQEYPIWARPVDIYNSETLGTNCVHYQAIRILAEMCRLKEQPKLAAKYEAYAAKIKEGINKYLWMQDKGYYAIYQYGRNHLVQHPQMEVLGEAFSILFGVADQQKAQSISQQVEEEAFGTPMMYPNLQDQYPYHNDAMWPFVQGYWMRAQAQVGNEAAVTKAISSIYRLASFGLTNYENMVIYNGDYHGLPINSPRQLWSVAANLAVVPGIYFGIQYGTNGIDFRPFVPKTMAGKRHLSNFKYRGMVLDMTISGYGNHLKSFKIDGQETKPYLDGSLTGNHTIEMVLDNVQPAPMQIKMVENAYQLATPVTAQNGNKLTWQAVEGATAYQLLKDGKKTSESAALEATLPGDGEYAVVALSADGRQSYMSEPTYYYKNYQLYQVEDYALQFDPNRKQIKESEGIGSNLKSHVQERAAVPTLQGVDISGHEGGCAMITRNENILITIPIEVKEAGTYALDWRYANGNGPINTENKCATRILQVDEQPAGVSVFPQRGVDAWNEWGWSNAQVVSLTAGKHIVTLQFADEVENMNITVNQALLDALRVTKL